MLHLTALALLHLAQAAAQAIANNPTPFEWASQHIHLVAWPTIVAIVGKVAWSASKWLTETKTQVDKTISQINTMATNHFPHMEKSLINMDKNIARLTMHQTGDASVSTDE